jgi:hypothetical protein
MHAVASMAPYPKTHPNTDNPALNGLVMIGRMYVTDGIRPPYNAGSNVFDDRAEKPLGMPTIDLTDGGNGGDPARHRDRQTSPHLDPLRRWQSSMRRRN